MEQMQTIKIKVQFKLSGEKGEVPALNRDHVLKIFEQTEVQLHTFLTPSVDEGK